MNNWRLALVLIGLFTALISVGEVKPPYNFESRRQIAVNDTFLAKLVNYALKSGEFQAVADFLKLQLGKNIEEEKRRDFELQQFDTPLYFKCLCSWRCLQLLADVNVQQNNAVAKWLFASDQRIKNLGDKINLEKDELHEVWSIIGDLVQGLGPYRKKYSNLIFAMALTWDTPPAALHDHLGKNPPPTEPDLLKRAQFFVKMYESPHKAAAYESLTLNDLLYVVYSPIPVSELYWALKNVSGNQVGWGRLYNRIDFDQRRIDAGIYDWPETQGAYTLKNIKEYGGLSHDRAYYTVMTARANGIPAIYMKGSNEIGAYDWCGIYYKQDKWELNYGRYEVSKKTIGDSFHPQTGECEPKYFHTLYYDVKYRDGVYLDAMQRGKIGGFLMQNGYASIGRSLISSGLRYTPFMQLSWLTALATQENQQWMASFYKEKMKQWSGYEDIHAETVSRLSLISVGRNIQEAERTIKSVIRKYENGRFDLSLKAVNNYYDTLFEHGKPREAVDFGLYFLDRYEKHGASLLPLVEKIATQSIDEPRMAQLTAAPLYNMFRSIARVGDFQTIESMVKILTPLYEFTGDDKRLNAMKELAAEMEEERKKRLEQMKSRAQRIKR